MGPKWASNKNHLPEGKKRERTGTTGTIQEEHVTTQDSKKSRRDNEAKKKEILLTYNIWTRR
jgi:hypothetical protein